jgi:hypothetical protein
VILTLGNDVEALVQLDVLALAIVTNDTSDFVFLALDVKFLKARTSATRSASMTLVISSSEAGLEESRSHPLRMNKDNKSIRPLRIEPLQFKLQLRITRQARHYERRCSV